MKSNGEAKGSGKMKLAVGVLGVALALMGGGQRVLAQAEASTQTASKASIEGAPRTYRLTYTISELDGSKHLGTQHFSLTVNPNSKSAELKLGSRVPVASGSFQTNDSGALKNIQYQYVDVGLNIDASVREFESGVQVFSNVDQSAIGEDESAVKSAPVIRHASLQNTALLTPGKPVTLGSVDIPGSTRHLDIEVVLEVVR
ncbi:MAG: hypothetical protein ABSG51_08275 [Terracidiphilus sp.]|jgi:hypothetical protein